MSELKLLTVGEIAKQLNCPIHKVLYLIQSRRINPLQRVGRFRVFGSDVVEALRSELTANQQHHSTSTGTGSSIEAGASVAVI